MCLTRSISRCLLSALVVAAACQSKKQQAHTLQEFVRVQEIESVEAYNYSGQHWLSAAELQDFKSRFGAMRYEPGGGRQLKSVDMGTTVFVLHSRGQTHHLIGSPTSQYLGIPRALATQNREELSDEDQHTQDVLLFEFSRPTNINNYRHGPKIPKRH
ncbi:hypothetical protein EJV47_04260 [Hymenobacter gummosus]|uniref:Uncharacterized protein n=1 Tax=Hymenobacter gummosus TaxID=1776032 RepID=A0A431U6I0_9BACT|nr:hypothetical protein [Hymenobacter gummosus]RTQ52246.1 hypothetical protein EJV47_04260 [Hymenobacter gummosus]